MNQTTLELLVCDLSAVVNEYGWRLNVVTWHWVKLYCQGREFWLRVETPDEPCALIWLYEHRGDHQSGIFRMLGLTAETLVRVLADALATPNLIHYYLSNHLDEQEGSYPAGHIIKVTAEVGERDLGPL